MTLRRGRDPTARGVPAGHGRGYNSGSPPPITLPPSTMSVWPVMKAPAREASSTASPATSSGTATTAAPAIR